MFARCCDNKVQSDIFMRLVLAPVCRGGTVGEAQEAPLLELFITTATLSGSTYFRSVPKPLSSVAWNIHEVSARSGRQKAYFSTSREK
ncbi:hypothetical protein E2C01_058907 [Portunus trituberculatus]|uniref:Uncharacterized protein n=1 Tax=Portunus trituberculatus TaxID=210409 RepID=A0A5B7H4F9_PORTR|nr:hypothetical protein [Portunus trituberculatus]